MSKYTKLTLHLASLDKEYWQANFDEIEKVLGFPLPDSARHYQAWWANQGRAQSLAWQSAGWKTSAVDLDERQITFVYSGGGGTESPRTAKLTIADAKQGLAANFGITEDRIEIIIRG